MAKQKTRGESIEYPAAFEAIWIVSRSGHKYPAFCSWESKGKPEPETVIAAWLSYMQTRACRSGFVKHLSTWLNARGWEDAYEAENVRPIASVSVLRCSWHQRPGTNNRPSRYPSDACPECRHIKAMNGSRQSDPQPMLSVLPKWMESPPTMTDEELAAMAAERKAR